MAWQFVSSAPWSQPAGCLTHVPRPPVNAGVGLAQPGLGFDVREGPPLPLLAPLLLPLPAPLAAPVPPAPVLEPPAEVPEAPLPPVVAPVADVPLLVPLAVPLVVVPEPLVGLVEPLPPAPDVPEPLEPDVLLPEVVVELPELPTGVVPEPGLLLQAASMAAPSVIQGKVASRREPMMYSSYGRLTTTTDGLPPRNRTVLRCARDRPAKAVTYASLSSKVKVARRLTPVVVGHYAVAERLLLVLSR